MEYPYIALLWRPGDPQRTLLVSRLLTKLERSQAWTPTLQRDGLTVFTRKPAASFLQVYPLADQQGVILGTLFSHDGRRLTPDDIAQNVNLADRCQRTGGEHLTGHYWGTYVALLSDRNTGDWQIVRDCSGMIPCYYTCVRGITLAFSDIRDILPLADIRDQHRLILRLQINWRYVTAFLAASQMQIRDTGIEGIFELLAGESLEYHDDRQTVRSPWNPVAIAQHDPWFSIEDACSEMRDTTRQCIESWAAAQNCILHSLSGGFDSSLVLALLMRAPRRPDVLCVNRYAPGPAEDERIYAAKVAEANGASLVEHPWEFQAFDARCLTFPVTAKPTLSQLIGGMDAPFYNEICSVRSCDAIWTGQGGDHLFWAVKTVLGAIDCWHHQGLGRNLIATLMETASLTGRSVPHIVGDVLFAALRHRAAERLTADFNITPQTAFLNPDVDFSELDRYTRHPWMTAAQILPPGKRMQIRLLAEVLNRHRPLPGLQNVQEFHPLLSQPLIELCLRIPIHQLLAGGKTRGLARIAFRDIMPSAILRREQKGQTTPSILQMFRRSAPFLRSLLLCGRLLSHSLLDSRLLEQALRADASITPTTLFPLFATIAAEAWVQSWSNRYSHDATVLTAGELSSTNRP